MSRPVTFRHRFIRSSVFDLRRKVLMRNFLRSQKTYAEMYDEEISENAKLMSSPGEFCENDQVSQEAPAISLGNETESSDPISDEISMDEETEGSVLPVETFEEPSNGDSTSHGSSGSKWKMSRKIRVRFSRKRRRSSDENSFVEAEQLSIPEEDKKMVCDPTVIHAGSDAIPVAPDVQQTKVKRNPFRLFWKQKVLVRQPYSFSCKNQCSEDYSSRVTRSMVLKPKRSFKKWKKMCHKRRKHSQRNHSTTSPSKNVKKDKLPAGLLKSRNSYPDEKHMIDSKLPRVNSVSVQTEITCFPEVPAMFMTENGPRSKRLKRDFTSNCENSYFLRSSSNSHATDYQHYPSRDLAPAQRSLWNQTNFPQYSSKLMRSRSIQENRIHNRINVCRRVRSVYLPNHDRPQFPKLYACENIKVAA